MNAIIITLLFVLNKSATAVVVKACEVDQLVFRVETECRGERETKASPLRLMLVL